MDVIVSSHEDTAPWSLSDLLGRSMGEIRQSGDRQFWIEPAGQAIATMKAINRGPHVSLDDALAEIERHTRGTCRRGP